MFPYSPLDPARNQIRLLRPLWDLNETMQPSVLREPERVVVEQNIPAQLLEFELQVVSLDDKPKYTALSYVWGKEAAGMKKIRLDGIDFHVGANLHSALCHIHNGDISPAIWIDAVSIN